MQWRQHDRRRATSDNRHFWCDWHTIFSRGAGELSQIVAVSWRRSMRLFVVLVVALIGSLLAGYCVAQSPRPFSPGFSSGFGVGTTSPSRPPSSTLSPGYFTVSGNQFLDGSGTPQRFACTQFLGAPNDGTMASIRQTGQFNCVVIDWRDQYLNAASPPNGCNSFTQIDTCVANAGANNLKVILSHRGNEIPALSTSPCWSRQANGLPYDSGGNSGNDDGCNDGHNVTYVQFLQNTVSLLQRYANNSTVIGYQVHHEPIVVGTYTGAANPNGGTNAAICWNCGNGDTDWLCISQEVGNDVAIVNPGVIEFVPGPINKTSTMLNGQPLSSGSGMMDLSAVAASPVGGGAGPAANKVAYAVDLYPSNVSNVTPDQGQTAITAWNTFFGYIEKNSQAPVMFLETGCSCDGSNGNIADDTAFMGGFVAYANGVAANGPTFTGRNVPMGTNWYAWGNLTSNPNGTLNPDGTLKSGQVNFFGQLGFTPPPAVATTWNPNDQVNVTVTNNNLTATSSASTGTGGVPATIRSTTSYSTGKVCFEVTASTITSDWDVGIVNAAFNLSNGNGVGSDANGIGFDPNFGLGSGSALGIFYNNAILSSATDSTGDANGAPVTVCVDFAAQSLWVTSPRMRALGSTWNNSPSANPATGAVPMSFAGLNCPCFISFNEFQPGGVAALNTTGPFAVATPAGFSAWDTAVASTTGRPFLILGMRDIPLWSH